MKKSIALVALSVALAVMALAWSRRRIYVEAELDLPPYDPRLWRD